MSKQFRELPIDSAAIKMGQTTTVKLENAYYRMFKNRATLTHDNGASPAMNFDDFLSLIADHNIVDGGQDISHNVPLEYFAIQNYYDLQGQLRFDFDNTANKAGAESYMDYIIPFIIPRAFNPEDAALDARSDSKTSLRILGGACSADDVTFKSMNVDIQGEEYLIDANEAAQIAARRKVDFKAVWTCETFTQTGVQDIDLDVKDMDLKRLFVVVRDNTSNARIDNGLSHFTLQTNNKEKTWIDRPADIVKTDNMRDYQLRATTEDLTGKTLMKGVYVLDLVKMGKLSQRVRASKLNSLKLRVNVSSACNVAVYSEKVMFI